MNAVYCAKDESSLYHQSLTPDGAKPTPWDDSHPGTRAPRPHKAWHDNPNLPLSD